MRLPDRWPLAQRLAALGGRASRPAGHDRGGDRRRRVLALDALERRRGRGRSTASTRRAPARERLSRALLDQETGVRGFALTGAGRLPRAVPTAGRQRRDGPSRELRRARGDADGRADAASTQRPRPWRDAVRGAGHRERPLPGAARPAPTGRPERGKPLFDELRASRRRAAATTSAALSAATRARPRRARRTRCCGSVIGIGVVLLVAVHRRLVAAAAPAGDRGRSADLAAQVRQVAARRLRPRDRRPTGRARSSSSAADIDAHAPADRRRARRAAATPHERSTAGRGAAALQRRARAVRLRRLARPAGAAAQGGAASASCCSAATAASSTSAPTSTSTSPSTAPSACRR